MGVTRKMLTDRGVKKKFFVQKKKKKILKLHEMSRKVAFFLCKTGQTDRQTDDIMMTMPFGKICRGAQNGKYLPSWLETKIDKF